MKRKLQFISALFILSVSSMGSWASSDVGNLKTYTATNKLMEEEHVLDGTIEAVMQSTVSSEITGRITEINFDVDDLVEKGSVLLRVRDNEYRARLAKAEASLNEAHAQHQDAMLEFNRAKDMFKKNVISEAQYDRANAAVKAADARVAASQAAVAEAKEQLANTVVRAPYSGVVIKRHIELGESVNPGTPLMAGLSLNQLRATVDVPQTFINAIRQHRKAGVLFIENGQRIDSNKMTVFPYADPQRHTFRVRVLLPEGLKNIYPGMLVKVAFTIDRKNRLMIPSKAVVQRSEVSAVYIVDDSGHVTMRQVRLGQNIGDETEVLAGMDSGEQVALDPVAAGIVLKEQLR